MLLRKLFDFFVMLNPSLEKQKSGEVHRALSWMAPILTSRGDANELHISSYSLHLTLLWATNTQKSTCMLLAGKLM